jgi:glucokinase
VFALAEIGDPQARQILNEAVSYAAMGICALINVLSPDAVLFSGGLSAQNELYVEPLIEQVRSMAYCHAVDGMHMSTAFLGAEAPAIGAAFLDL